jgi:hypothetical protein
MDAPQKTRWIVFIAYAVMGAVLMSLIAYWEMAGLYFIGLLIVGITGGIIWPKEILVITLGIILGQGIFLVIIGGPLGLGLMIMYYLILSLICTVGALIGAGIRYIVSALLRQ